MIILSVPGCKDKITQRISLGENELEILLAKQELHGINNYVMPTYDDIVAMEESNRNQMPNKDLPSVIIWDYDSSEIEEVHVFLRAHESIYRNKSFAEFLVLLKRDVVPAPADPVTSEEFMWPLNDDGELDVDAKDKLRNDILDYVSIALFSQTRCIHPNQITKECTSNWYTYPSLRVDFDSSDPNTYKDPDSYTIKTLRDRFRYDAGGKPHTSRWVVGAYQKIPLMDGETLITKLLIHGNFWDRDDSDEIIVA